MKPRPGFWDAAESGLSFRKAPAPRGGNALVENPPAHQKIASYPTSCKAKTSILVPQQHRLYVSADKHETNNARFYVYNVNE